MTLWSPIKDSDTRSVLLTIFPLLSAMVPFPSLCFATHGTSGLFRKSTHSFPTFQQPVLQKSARFANRHILQCTTVDEIVRMTPRQLEVVYSNGSVTEVPDGDFLGTPVVLPGTPLGPMLTALLQATLWSGKLCDAANGTLVNKWGPAGLIRAIPAQLRITDSWTDGSTQCAEIDYSSTMPWPLSNIRDEFRLIEKDMYLGIVYIDRKPVAYFVLQPKA